MIRRPKWKQSSFPHKTVPRSHTRRFVVPTQDESSFPQTTIHYFQKWQFFISTQENWCFVDGNSKRHFWTNFDERPRIFPNFNPMRKNPGTIAKIRLKVAYGMFDVFVARRPAFFCRSKSFLGSFCQSNVSKLIRIAPHASENFEKLPKTSKNFAKTFTKTFFTAQ